MAMHPDDELEAWESLGHHWVLVIAEIERQCEQVKGRLVQRGQVSTLEDLAFKQGQIEGMNTILKLPKEMIDKLKKRGAK